MIPVLFHFWICLLGHGILPLSLHLRVHGSSRRFVDSCLDYPPGSIIDKNCITGNADIITETETETECQSFPAFFRSTKTYLSPLLDTQIQYFKSLLHSFQDTYDYFLDLATFSQSIAVLVAVEWKAITLDAFIMTSDFLHKQNRHSSRTDSSA